LRRRLKVLQASDQFFRFYRIDDETGKCFGDSMPARAASQADSRLLQRNATARHRILGLALFEPPHATASADS
jgi:hypothetical protein